MRVQEGLKMNQKDKAGFRATRSVERAHCGKHKTHDLGCKDCALKRYQAVDKNFPALIGMGSEKPAPRKIPYCISDGRCTRRDEIMDTPHGRRGYCSWRHRCGHKRLMNESQACGCGMTEDDG